MSTSDQKQSDEEPESPQKGSGSGDAALALDETMAGYRSSGSRAALKNVTPDSETLKEEALPSSAASSPPTPSRLSVPEWHAFCAGVEDRPSRQRCLTATIYRTPNTLMERSFARQRAKPHCGRTRRSTG